MFEGYPEEDKKEARRKGGQNSTVDSITAAKSRMTHGMYASELNYYYSLDENERRFLDKLSENLIKESNIPNRAIDSPEDYADEGFLRDAIIRYWRVEKMFSDGLNIISEMSKNQLINDAERQRNSSIREFRNYDILDEGEEDISQHYPTGALFGG